MGLICQFKDEGSRFTYRDLLDINSKQKAWKSPLSCICHIDMNAFFAQCEQIRLGLSDKDPIVCVQWSTIIAVSYAAREYGISRMDRLEEAKLKCPNLILAHTAVFKRGQPVWKYTDYLPSPKDHKVSLDPYRRESRKIMNLFKANCDLTEKASVDECFLDLGRLVFARITEQFPTLITEMESIDSSLPVINKLPKDLDFKGFIIPMAGDKEPESKEVQNGEFIIEDWDDIIMLFGSIICYELRMKTKDQLGYYTSGGIGRVKTIAKLASDFKKPNQQTIVRNGALSNFLSNFDLTDFWSLGGKTGQYIKSKLGDGDLIKKIRADFDSPNDLVEVFDNDKDLAERLFRIVRGELRAPLEPKLLAKSMGANKNFRGKAVPNPEGLNPWLQVFVGELVLRLQELDEEIGTVIRGTKLTLGATSRLRSHHTKQCTINANIRDFKQLHQMLWENALKLVKSMVETWNRENPKTNMFPLYNASLSISGLVESSGVNTLDDLMDNVKKRVRNHSPVEEFIDIKPINNGTLDSLLKKKAEEIERDPNRLCYKCQEKISIEEWISHQDFHLAQELDSKYNKVFEETIADKILRSKKKRKLSGQSKLPFT